MPGDEWGFGHAHEGNQLHEVVEAAGLLIPHHVRKGDVWGISAAATTTAAAATATAAAAATTTTAHVAFVVAPAPAPPAAHHAAGEGARHLR